jgi:hypothetical protein
MAIGLVLIGGQPASATPIDYKVNVTILGGSVTGDIITDGTIGALSSANITNWILTVNEGVDPPFTMTGPSSGNNSHLTFGLLADTVDPLNATATQLTWRFDQTPPTDPAQILGFFVGPNLPLATYNWIFFNSTGGGCCGPASESIGGPANTNAQHLSFANGTTQVLGSAVSTVPEPASVTLTALGLSGLVARYRRRSKPGRHFSGWS